MSRNLAHAQARTLRVKFRVGKMIRVSCLHLMLLIAGSVHATDGCFESVDPLKQAFMVPIGHIEDRINDDAFASGIILAITLDGEALLLDALAAPGTTSAAAFLRVVWMVARLAEQEYSEMRFVSQGEVLFVIDGASVQRIGCQFVWGEEGAGQNPIHLMRLFADGLRYPTGERVAPAMTGSLLGDTSTAVSVLNEEFTRKWVLANIDLLDD